VCSVTCGFTVDLCARSFYGTIDSKIYLSNTTTTLITHTVQSYHSTKLMFMTPEEAATNGSKKNTPKITVSKNGPYLVSGGVPILKQIITVDSEGTPVEWREGTKYSTKESCALCRCGESKNKPFCDGTHVKVGFDGAEKASSESYLDKPNEIDGPTLKLTDVKELCASARFCHRAGGIWHLVPKSDNPQASQIACEEAHDCPSGRLLIKNKKTQQVIEPKFEPSIGLVEDPAIGVSGPLWVRGCIPVESTTGKTYKIRNRVTLCRCGKSANKPFCDSSHYPE
jgi:CDGSH-type Zn-finger protein